MTFGELINQKSVKFAKELRKNMTKQERRLWYDFLRLLPIRWYRQKVIGKYIADFYCDKLKIVIELDGGQHYDKLTIEYDKKRTEFFNQLGIEVIRFPNNEVDKHFLIVCEEIYRTINERIEHPPVCYRRHPPSREGRQRSQKFIQERTDLV